MLEHPDTESADERRLAPRTSTSRKALFSSKDKDDFPRNGTATDISRNGLRIVTGDPYAAGSLLEVELKPRDGIEDSQLIIVEAHVIHVTEIDSGEHAMGLRLHTGPTNRSDVLAGALKTGTNAYSTSRGQSLSDLSQLLKQTSTIEKNQFDAVFKKVGDMPDKSHIESSRKSSRVKRYLVLMLILFLLLLLILLGAHKAGLLIRLYNPKLSTLQSKKAPNDKDPKSNNNLSTVPMMYDSNSPMELLVNAQATLAEGHPDGAEKLFQQLQEHPGANPTELFLAKLGRAEALGAQQKTSLALMVIQGAMDMTGQVHDVWLEAAKDLHFVLFQTEGKPFEVKPMVEALLLSEEPRLADSEGKLIIEIDRDKYTLTIKKGNEVLRAFPVGLGCNEATPSGNYKIVNKITDPAWYNKGDVVDPGDPDNPLGKHWLGLGNEEGPTRYGIHPTTEPGSIRQSMSRGCIRMRPKDAETVFRLVPIGTTVYIGTWE